VLPPSPFPAPGVRGPAGEVPANSRRPHDEGALPAAERAGYAYSFPGVPGTGTHYHVLVPDRGAPEAALAGGATDRSLALRIFRARRAPDGALAVRDALAGTGAAAEILDPAVSKGCDGAADHPAPGTGLRAAPPVRVVRTRIAAADLSKADAALSAAAGLERILETRLGGPAAGEVVLDVHVVE
jgi:hypothetical protein